MAHHAVLIVAADPLAAALLGAAVEQDGSAPHFPQAGEAPRTALRRVRPRLVLISCDHADACTDGFIGPALMTGARILLIKARTMSAEVREIIDRLDLPLVDLSRDPDALGRRLATLDED